MQLIVSKSKRRDGRSLSISEWTRAFSEKGLLSETSVANVYELRGPKKSLHRLDLNRWAACDPEKTFISISFLESARQAAAR